MRPEQAKGVPVHPLLDEPAVHNSAEESSFHVDGSARRLNAFDWSAVGTVQGPMRFDYFVLGDLTFDSQVEAMQDAAVAADTLL